MAHFALRALRHVPPAGRDHGMLRIPSLGCVLFGMFVPLGMVPGGTKQHGASVEHSLVAFGEAQEIESNKE